jgi:hypothetical protein
MDLIDREGITHSAFKQWKRAQICNECKSGNLEFLPIYKGQKLDEVTNGILWENWKQNKKQESEKEFESKQKKPKEIYINKYSGNRRLPLHESVIIGITPNFVTIPANYMDDGDVTPTFTPKLATGTGITYLPNGTIDTVTPLPYVFSSEEEFSKYLKLALTENYDTLYLKVDSIYKKYVNVDEFYYPILVADTIWSYFQDRFAYTHYLIFTGDMVQVKTLLYWSSNILVIVFFMSCRQMRLITILHMVARKSVKSR